MAVLALVWGAVGLLWAQVIVLPDPLLPPRAFAELLGDVPSATDPERFVVMIVKETSLSLCAFAFLGVAVAGLAWRAGARGGGLVAAVLCATALAASLVPVAQAWRAASAEGTALSLSEYVAGSPATAEYAPETATYARPDGGEDLGLDVWRPPRGESGGEPAAFEGRPAVIVVHGGGWRSGERGEFPLWNRWLAGQGYVVFDIEYRLAPPPTWRDAPADVNCAVGWVKENAARYGVDPDRVALMGRSAGGHLALLTAYAPGEAPPSPGCDLRGTPDTDVAAAVGFYPPTDLARLDRRGYLAGMDLFVGGPRGGVPDRYRSLSPVSRADAGDPPTFLAHGGGDEIVPAGQSGLLAGRLRAAGVPRRHVELPWANHTFDFSWGGWGAQITRSALAGFLEDHLETPDRPEAARPRPASKN